MKPAHRSVMTPQPLSCVMHHVLLPSAPEHACHRTPSRAPPEPSPRLKGACGGEGMGVVLLDASSTSQNSGRCHSATGVCQSGFLPPSYAITEQNGDGGMSEVVVWELHVWNVHYWCSIFVIRTSPALCIWSSCRGLPAEDGNVPASVWTSCVWNIGRRGGA